MLDGGGCLEISLAYIDPDIDAGEVSVFHGTSVESLNGIFASGKMHEAPGAGEDVVKTRKNDRSRSCAYGMAHQSSAQLIGMLEMGGALPLLRFCHPPTTMPSVESSIASHVRKARNNGLSMAEAGVLLLNSLSRAIFQIVECAPT